MVVRYFWLLLFLLTLVPSLHAQTVAIRDEYLNILPFRSTIEDVTKMYGEGRVVVNNPDVYLAKNYTLNDGAEITIDYFKDCRQGKDVPSQREWIVRSVFFSFSEDKKILPKHIYLNKKNFTRFLYGDVLGQIIYQSSDKRFSFTYLCDRRSVSDLEVGPSAADRKKFSCFEPSVNFVLDPAGLTEIEQESDIGSLCRRLMNN
ncbi:MAG: hypothetical protein IPM63_13495 [Acidobacteriota bacterium]|nr:MAG: hypothetical protein IPM63_13495 [Acidobacteriota bacterium]